MTRIRDEDNASRIQEVVPQVMMTIREQMRSAARGRFTVPQFRILNQLSKRPRTNGELAAWMGVTAPTMSRMIETLEAKDYVSRTSDPKDRRVQTLTLTASGKRETDKIRRVTRESFAAKVETLSDEQTLQLSQGLEILAQLFMSGTSSERTRPSMNTKLVTKTKALVALLALATLASSCLGDKNVDDYAAEKAAQNKAKYDQIAGNYQGSLVADDTGTSLGNLALNLETQMNAITSSDNTGSAAQAQLAGSVMYSGNNSSVAISKANYNDQDGSLDISLTGLKDAAGNTHVISLHGTLNGNTYTGTMEEDDSQVGFPTRFKLVKDARVSMTQRLNIARVIGPAAGKQVFQGHESISTSRGQVDSDLSLQINYEESSEDALFLNLFLRVRYVTVLMSFDPQYPPVTFANVALNEAQNHFHGSADASVKSGPVHFELSCDAAAGASNAPNWNCEVEMGIKRSQVLFRLVDETSSDSTHSVL